jgi:sulfhydrogenase subunit beta (sulfur reductase)
MPASAESPAAIGAPRVLMYGELTALLDDLLPERRVAGPVQRDGALTFGFLESAGELVLAPEPTFASFKAAAFPSEETILEYELGESPTLEPVLPEEPTVVFGLHPCDLHALRLTDRVFAGGSWDAPPDPAYLARRRNLVVVGLDCRSPCGAESFCRDMGTLDIDEGYDALLVDLGDRYFVQIGSEAGAALFDRDGVSLADAAAIDQVEALREGRLTRFARRLDQRFEHLPQMLRSHSSSRVWETLGAKCLACGSCTAVCPTCFCFDVVERLRTDLSGGERCRVWDSCQLRSFAVVAGGHNFRDRQSARQRHFVMHKSAAIPDAYGVPGCVGCGRCATACPVDISQIDIYNMLAREQ